MIRQPCLKPKSKGFENRPYCLSTLPFYQKIVCVGRYNLAHHPVKWGMPPPAQK